jgi:predicted lysophospholipase L1 biosynthesis ABC-type transport system permease subunit
MLVVKGASARGRQHPGKPSEREAHAFEHHHPAHVLRACSERDANADLLVAILLSAIGLAGLAGYTVAQRTREIGLRIALGARAGQVVRAILAPMSRPIAIGFICGALGGSAVAKVLRSGLPAMTGINLFDPLAYLMAMASFVAVVALSILAPGRRAIRVQPQQSAAARVADTTESGSH